MWLCYIPPDMIGFAFIKYCLVRGKHKGKQKGKTKKRKPKKMKSITFYDQLFTFWC